MAKLSVTMTRTIEAIRAGGGEVHSLKGGYWSSSPDGTPLEIATDDWREKDFVGTQTVYGLLTRGMLEKLPDTGNRWHSAFRLTPTEANPV